MVFCWENFGPTHKDRCEAVAARSVDTLVIGLERNAVSEIYSWKPEHGERFKKITFGSSRLPFALWLVTEVWRSGAQDVFLCHYHEVETQIAAILLNMLGMRIFLMIDSKFDDVPRQVWRELVKSWWIKPYRGAIVGSRRTGEYLRFLGMRPERIVQGYDTISTARIRQAATASLTETAVQDTAFEDRHITIVARLVHKKNLFTAITAFALFNREAAKPRLLRIFGDGELLEPLRAHAEACGVAESVQFEGFRQTDEVCRALATSLMLLLVSTEEQFGFSVVEALALGVPVMVATNVGARDDFVRNGVNGFVVEPDNPEGIAALLGRVDRDEVFWDALSRNAADWGTKADAAHFATAVEEIVSRA